MIKMEKDPHFKALEMMYLAAPINEIYRPIISVSEGVSEIEIRVKEAYFHSLKAVHGSVYFKMLDDAAFFAANSLERKMFVLTASFTTHLTRPISSGIIKSEGKVLNQNQKQFTAESIAYDGQGNVIARGNGTFVRSKFPLKNALGYGGV